MIRELGKIMQIPSAVTFSKQDDALVIMVNINGSVSSIRMSFEDFYYILLNDQEKAEYLLGEALEGLYDETKLKAERDCKLRSILADGLSDKEEVE